MNNKSKRKLNISFSSLLYNKRFLLIFSFVISFILWMWVAIEQSPEVQKVITNVPVSIKYENSVPEKLGLQIFGQSDFYVDITVTGKKYIVSSLTADDFTVVANTNNADSIGKKMLKLHVEEKEANSDFTITSYSENEIEVFFDRYQELELPITVNVNTSLDNIVPDEHKLGEAVPSVDRLTISGPSTIISQIETMNANVSVDEVLTQTTTLDADIVLLSKDGTVVDSSLLKLNESNITITLPVLKIVTLPTAVEFKNAPAYYTNKPISYNVYPSTVQAAVPVDLVETTKYYVVDVIDFSQISNTKNVYKIKAEDSKSFDFLNSNVNSFSVTIDASAMTKMNFIVPNSNIVIKNSDSFYDVKPVEYNGVAITVVGPENVLSELSGNDFQIMVEVPEQEEPVDRIKTNGRVVVPNNKQCWSIGESSITISFV